LPRWRIAKVESIPPHGFRPIDVLRAYAQVNLGGKSAIRGIARMTGLAAAFVLAVLGLS
jgi:hypothetical protein